MFLTCKFGIENETQVFWMFIVGELLVLQKQGWFIFIKSLIGNEEGGNRFGWVETQFEFI